MTVSRVAPYDANFVYSETPRVRSSIVTSYAFPNGSASTESLVDWIADRAERIPELRQRFVRSYLDVGDAYWSEDPDFDARRHIGVESSMSWPRLVRYITQLHDESFDPDRPMWRVRIIRDVRIPMCDVPTTVVVLWFHHSVADGMGVAAIARQLFDEKTVARPIEVGEPTTRVAVTARELVRLPLRFFLVLADLWRLIAVSRRSTRDRKAGVWRLPDVEPLATSINRPLGPDRESAVVFASVADVRRIAKSIGDVSVNDVVLSTVGRAVATYLGDPGQPLASCVPVSVRDIVDPDMRNGLGFGTVALRTDLPFDEQVRAVHDQVRSERDRLNLPTFAAMYSVLPRLPGFAYRGLYWMGQRRASREAKPDFTQLRVSTIPKGAADTWQLAGSTPVACFGVTPLADGLGLNHTVSTIGDSLAIGVMADPSQVRDVPAYVDTLRKQLEYIGVTSVRA